MAGLCAQDLSNSQVSHTHLHRYALTHTFTRTLRNIPPLWAHTYNSHNTHINVQTHILTLT